jgi:hypothetical protein
VATPLGSYATYLLYDWGAVAPGPVNMLYCIGGALEDPPIGPVGGGAILTTSLI